jgi:hypothetical protein
MLGELTSILLWKLVLSAHTPVCFRLSALCSMHMRYLYLPCCANFLDRHDTFNQTRSAIFVCIEIAQNGFGKFESLRGAVRFAL